MYKALIITLLIIQALKIGFSYDETYSIIVGGVLFVITLYSWFERDKKTISLLTYRFDGDQAQLMKYVKPVLFTCCSLIS